MSIRFFVSIFFLWLASCTARAQESFFAHFSAIQPEVVTIFCEWDSLLAFKDDKSWDARVLVTAGDSVQEWNAEITPRGKFRRSRCVFPPLELNLKKRELRDRGMLEFDKLKIVTHCNSEDARPEDLFEELLIYRLYNIVTEHSFLTTTFRVDYLYPNGKAYRKNSAVLMLEPTEELAYRTGGDELEGYSVPADSLDAQSYLCNALFQFMVGNSDWSQTLQRNIKMVGEPASYHVIPYDFDFSAIVSPPYALLTSDHDLQNFMDRVYLGAYFSEQLPAAVGMFCQKKTAILQCVKDNEFLSKSRRNQIVDYLEIFFNYIEEPGRNIVYGTILRYE